MAATVIAIGADGALSSIQTTVLLSVEDTLAALQKSIIHQVSATRRKKLRMPRGPKGEKRPADVIGNAVHVMKIATGEIREAAAGD